MNLRCPARLSPEAKKEWKRIVPAMLESGLILEADKTIIEMYCSIMGDVRELEKDLAENGRVVTTPNGMPMPSPSWSQLRQARDSAVKLAVQLGLTPKARKTLGIGIVKKEENDDFK